MIAYLAGLGMLGPGLLDGQQGLAALASAELLGAALRAPVATGLSPNEARRCPASARYALDVGMQALSAAGWDAACVATVLSSGSGDLEILDKNCRALTQTPAVLSPTLFHNSVHNAAGGYWGIATHSRAPTTSLSAYDASFAAGLLEALTTLPARRTCLLVAYDLPAPAALASVRKVVAPFAVALALCAEPPRQSPLARLDWRWQPRSGATETAMPVTEREALRQGNPAARALPLLEAIAKRRPTTVVWPCPRAGELQAELSFLD